MGIESSHMNGLQLEEKAIETTDYWTLYSASNGETKLSIFKSKTGIHGQSWTLEKMTKNLMLHRHPFILKYVSSWNKGTDFYLAVESAKPLHLYQNQLSSIQICLGLRNVIGALVFLHEQAHAFHNNICISSIYVTQNGTWKLGGVEFLMAKSKMTGEFLAKSKGYRYTKSIDPDEEKNNGSGCDQYAFANLVLDLQKHLKHDDVAGFDEFSKYCSAHLKHQNFVMRPQFSSLLLHPFFNHDIIMLHSFLSDLPIKSNKEKTEFFKKLHGVLMSLDEQDIATHLGELLISRMVLLDLTAQEFLLPYLFNPKTKTNPDGLFTEPVFKSIIAPKLLNVFRVRDLQIRMILLHHFASFIKLFKKTDLQEHILPELLLGIKDSNDELVALTLRSLAELVPLLGSSAVIGGKREKLFSNGKPKDLVPIEKSSNLTLLTNTERPSPDGEEDHCVNNLVSKDTEDWKDWGNDHKISEPTPIIEQKPIVINDILNLDIKVNKSKPVEQDNELDLFHDMEPVIQASNVFLVDEVAKTNLELNSFASTKFEVSNTLVDDGWDDTSNWSE